MYNPYFTKCLTPQNTELNTHRWKDTRGKTVKMEEGRLKLMEGVVATAGSASNPGPRRPEVACRVVPDMCALCRVVPDMCA